MLLPSLLFLSELYICQRTNGSPWQSKIEFLTSNTQLRALKPCHGTSIIARLSFHFPRVLFFSGTSAEGYRGKKLCHRETRGGWYTVLGRSEVPQATRSPRVQKSDVLIYQLVSMSRRIPSHQLRTDIDLLLLRLIIG